VVDYCFTFEGDKQSVSLLKKKKGKKEVAGYISGFSIPETQPTTCWRSCMSLRYLAAAAAN